MGYFSNGTEGWSYYEHYCERCIHEDQEKGKRCPIWDLHQEFNYKDCNNKDSYLHVFIPRNGAGNEECKMFIERGAMRHLL